MYIHLLLITHIWMYFYMVWATQLNLVLFLFGALGAYSGAITLDGAMLATRKQRACDGTITLHGAPRSHGAVVPLPRRYAGCVMSESSKAS